MYDDVDDVMSDWLLIPMIFYALLILNGVFTYLIGCDDNMMGLIKIRVI